MKSQLKLGMKIESEHKHTVAFIRKFVKRYHKVPSNKIIFKDIAKDHLREDPKYYLKLKKAKL